MPKIILATINAKWIHPSLALRLLKANLKELENECEILEFALRQPLNEKLSPILSSGALVFGLSISVWNHLASLELLKELHAKWHAHQKPIVVLGGPEVSFLDENSSIFQYSDYVIRGEGEESFRLLCMDLLGGDNPKTLETRPVFINNKEEKIDLLKASFAYHYYSEEDLKKKHVYVETSRGCPFSCAYCQAYSSCGNRAFPLDNICKEIEDLVVRGAKKIKFLDRSFNLNNDRAAAILEFLLSLFKENDLHSICFHFELLPFRISPKLKEILGRFPANSLRLELGIQTFNIETAKLIKRPFTSLEMNEEAENLEYLRYNTNAILHVDLIAGLPGESMLSFKNGFDRLWRILNHKDKNTNNKFEIQLGILKGLPGTDILKLKESMNMRYSDIAPYEVLETGVMSFEEINSLKNFARFWELLVNRNPFPSIINSVLTSKTEVFDTFMELSNNLYKHFGKNWGIDKKEMSMFLKSYIVN